MRVLTSDLATGGCSVWDVTDSLLLEKRCSFGAKGRHLYVQKLCSFVWRGKEYILAGRKGLTLDIYDADDDFRCIKTKHLMTTQAESDFFVSLEVIDDGEFKACTGLGYCYFLSLETLLTSCYNDFSMSFGLHGSVSFFKFLPQSSASSQQHKRVIVGGKDREVAVIEIDTHTNVWKSKTVKKVDKVLEGYVHREPVWIQDVAIIPQADVSTSPTTTDDCRIVAATRFGKLLFYDPNITKYPLDEMQVCDNPIKHIRLIGDIILVADGFNNVVLLNHTTLSVVNRLRIPLGPLSSMATFPLDNDRRSSSRFLTITSSSVDKRLRLYVFEGGYATCMDTVNADTISSDLILLNTDTLPPVLEDWLAEEEPTKRHRL